MPIDTETLAREIFVNWATQAGPTNWQWNEMAKAALNAAECFAAMSAQEQFVDMQAENGR